MQPQPAAYSFDLESDDERLIPLAEAGRTVAKMMGRDKAPHINQVRRWAKCGARGAKLPTVLIAGRRMTSRRAIAWWVGATTAAADSAKGHFQEAPSELPMADGDLMVLKRAGIVR